MWLSPVQCQAHACRLTAAAAWSLTRAHASSKRSIAESGRKRPVMYRLRMRACGTLSPSRHSRSPLGSAIISLSYHRPVHGGGNHRTIFIFLAPLLFWCCRPLVTSFFSLPISSPSYPTSAAASAVFFPSPRPLHLTFLPPLLPWPSLGGCERHGAFPESDAVPEATLSPGRQTAPRRALGAGVSQRLGRTRCAAAQRECLSAGTTS